MDVRTFYEGEYIRKVFKDEESGTGHEQVWDKNGRMIFESFLVKRTTDDGMNKPKTESDEMKKTESSRQLDLGNGISEKHYYYDDYGNICDEMEATHGTIEVYKFGQLIDKYDV